MFYDIEKRAKELAKQYDTEQKLEQLQQENNELIAMKDKTQQMGGLSVTVADIQDEQGNIDMGKVGANYFAAQINNGESLNNLSLDVAKASMTNDIMGDRTNEGEKYRKELKDEQKQAIKESFKQDRLKGQKQTLDDRRAKAESFYLSVRPILEFDFDNLVGAIDPNKKPKEYKDRSYGIPLMVLMLALLIVPYCAFSILLAFFNGINATLKTISTFGKISRYIAYSVFIIGVGALIIYGGILGVEKLFSVNILP